MAERAASEDQRPWREGQDVALQDLKVTLANYKPVQLKQDPVSAINVLLVGPVGSGKSSFVNTIKSAFKGRVAFPAGAGSTRTEKSYTTECQRYVVYHPASGHPMKFRLCDTRGLDTNPALDFNSFTRGCAEAGLTFGKLVPRGRFWGTSMDDKVHCLVIVLDSRTLIPTNETVRQKIMTIRQNARIFGLPQAVLLTKVDQLDPRVGADVSLVFRSPEVEDAVSKAAEQCSVPHAHVLPVKNYESEGTLVPELDKLALHSLRSMLHLADDFFHNLPHENPRPQGESAEESVPQRPMLPSTEPESPPNQDFFEWAVFGLIIVMAGLYVADKFVGRS